MPITQTNYYSPSIFELNRKKYATSNFRGNGIKSSLKKGFAKTQKAIKAVITNPVVRKIIKDVYENTMKRDVAPKISQAIEQKTGSKILGETVSQAMADASSEVLTKEGRANLVKKVERKAEEQAKLAGEELSKMSLTDIAKLKPKSLAREKFLLETAQKGTGKKKLPFSRTITKKTGSFFETR